MYLIHDCLYACMYSFTTGLHYSLVSPDIGTVQMLIDLLSDIEGVPPSEILLALRSLLGSLSTGVTFPHNVSEVSWLMLD